MIRRLTVADTPAFRAIRLEALRLAPDAYGSTLADWKDAGIDRFEARLGGSSVLGAFDGELAGVAALDVERGGNVRHRGLVTMIYVTPASRGRGMAQAMMRHLEQVGAEMELLQLELHVAADNPAAIAVYEKAGYRHHGLIPRALLSRGRFIDEMLMIRRLDG